MQALPFATLPADLGGTTGPDLTRYLLVCAVLVIGVAAIGFGFRRLIAGSLRARAAKRSLRVLDVLPLGGKQRLSVVRCYDRTFLLGLGDKNVSLVAELDPIIGEDEAPAPDFEALLSTAKKRVVTKPGVTKPAVPKTGAKRPESLGEILA